MRSTSDEDVFEPASLSFAKSETTAVKMRCSDFEKPVLISEAAQAHRLLASATDMSSVASLMQFCSTSIPPLQAVRKRRLVQRGSVIIFRLGRMIYSAASRTASRSKFRRYLCIWAAASRPSRMAQTTRLAPRTISPAA